MLCGLELSLQAVRVRVGSNRLCGIGLAAIGCVSDGWQEEDGS